MKANLHVGMPRAVRSYALVRRRVRWAAGALALANAMVYALIGIGVLHVSDVAEGDAGLMLVFGVMSAAAFLIGAVLLWAFDRRPLWIVGAAFQAFAIIAYVNVAPQRTPPFEVWGVSLKVAQALLLVLLLALAVTHVPEERPLASGQV